jgi:CsoR family transcriptional regulator, copper-sensing transcriptional repressor
MAQPHNDDIKRRLNRIKGQVEGIQRMADRPKPTVEIFHQITAAKKALDSAGRFLLEQYIKDNLSSVSKSKEEENKLREIIEIIERF